MMAAAQPSFRLDPLTGWRLSSSAGVVWNAGGARLAQRPGNLRPLDDPSGDLGGRAMPRRVASGPGGQIYLITGRGRLVWYDPCVERFAPIPCGQDARLGLLEPVALSVTRSGELLVLDGRTRMVTALSLLDWRVKRQWGPCVVVGGALHPARPRIGVDPTTGRPDGTLVLPGNVWNPVDIAALADGRVAVSEGDTGTIAYFDWRGCLMWASDGASDDFGPLQGPGALAVGHDGALYVLETGGPAVARLEGNGLITARTDDPEALPLPIEAGALAVDPDGTIWVSSRLQGAARPQCCEPSGRIAPLTGDRLIRADCDVLAFDADGRALVGTLGSPCLHRADQVARLEAGQAWFERLDGGRIGTVWDRARLTATIPEGTSLHLLAYASDAALDETTIAALPRVAWVATALNARNAEAVAAIRTPPGRYLWLRLELAGDGVATPVVGAMTVTYPRRSSARHLPAIWSSEPQSADFLARFMMLFDEVRADTVTPLDDLAAYIDPMATPAAEVDSHGDDFLDWLGGWIGLALDRKWSVERRRKLVAEAPKLFAIKGTVEGLRRHVEIYTGIAPKIVEHFKLRRWMTLDESTLDGVGTLWGPDLVRRLELDGYSEIGRFALVDGGDPLTDPIAAFAHRASVYVPVSDDLTDTDLAQLEAVVEAARPAHVAVDIRVVRPRFVMGCDILLGVNTILGTATETATTDQSILGDDIRLAAPPHAFSLAPGTRLGVDTTLK
jgi:phage tail-like protein